MGTVVTLQPRLPGKCTQLLVDAIEYEKTAPPDEPIQVIAVDVAHKVAMQRQLQCMMGMRHTRIEVLTAREWQTRIKIREEQETRNV